MQITVVEKAGGEKRNFEVKPSTSVDSVMEMVYQWKGKPENNKTGQLSMKDDSDGRSRTRYLQGGVKGCPLPGIVPRLHGLKYSPWRSNTSATGIELVLELALIDMKGRDAVSVEELFMYDACTGTRFGDVAIFVLQELAETSGDETEPGIHQMKMFLGDYGVHTFRFLVADHPGGPRFFFEEESDSNEELAISDLLCYDYRITVQHKFLGQEDEVVTPPRTLEDNRVRPNTVLEYSISTDTRKGGLPAFVDLSAEHAISKQAWNSSAPAWRIAAPGLTLEGYCRNPQCQAHNRMVIYNRGFKSFDLMTQASDCECPICKTRVEPIKPGFNNCVYTIAWASPAKSTAVHRKPPTKVGDHYETYDEFKAGTIEYTKMVITARPLPKPRNGQPPKRVPPGASQTDVPLFMSNDCGICFSPLRQDMSDTLGLPCGHAFHENCANRWFSAARDAHNSPTCPLCRAEIAA
mmetsp:Transcript_13465/g.23891  ORF Transcript_13465/g.23891 Transcript_13465/m.23891 type:complete len:465 (-) Transcript_13465:220-1614(-)|eukprot:CAMPEP_0177754900 /NCGR_PEP_ID=MMETSP0491_2-20121128/2262_1 /TAXON_ID=63592 /ORGANISM="Tetraselmis chuii, Strain PLY429" /LENGTH=464 /DNA_ID=CAMNT_0019270327 /DNA_START=448 /DNA_END=1842 /DNA_ORIENTATION=+